MDNKEIGKKIKTWRLLKGITQDELAQKFNSHRSTVSRVEKGLLEPNAHFIKALASLGMNIDELLPADKGIEKQKALHLRVSELEIKLMKMESQIADLIKLVQEKL